MSLTTVFHGDTRAINQNLSCQLIAVNSSNVRCRTLSSFMACIKWLFATSFGNKFHTKVGPWVIVQITPWYNRKGFMQCCLLKTVTCTFLHLWQWWTYQFWHNLDTWLFHSANVEISSIVSFVAVLKRDFCFKISSRTGLNFVSLSITNSTIWIRKIPSEKSLWDTDLCYPVNTIKLGKDQFVRGERDGNWEMIIWSYLFDL